MVGIILLFIHLIFAALLHLLIRTGKLNIDTVFFSIILFVPFAGEAAAGMLAYAKARKLGGLRRNKVEAISEREISLKDPLVTDGPTSAQVAPLEDVLILSDPAVRRSSIMDVLMQDTDQYISSLERARNHRDAEVAHYASTAMVELSRNYELELQDYERRSAKNPNDDQILRDYTIFLKRYLDTGLIEGNLLEEMRERFRILLTKKIKGYETLEDDKLLAQSFLDSKLNSEAHKVISSMEKLWPNSQEVWLLRFRYCYETKDGKRMQQMASAMKNSGVYKRREVREALELWI
jgi:hypothetical protein